ncbi:MAG TPA: glycosyltransferase [Gemmatimonadales bacterium]|nr:glycosyltransferase [Gemmatimonadales bacterium]
MTPRVVHVASGREWRGGQRQVWLLARELARTPGVEQVVVTGAGSELAERLRNFGIAIRAVPWTAGLDPRVMPWLLAELRQDGTIVHAHDAHAVTLGGLAARLMGRPFVATRRVDFHLRRRGFWTRADRVIAISRAVAEVLIADGVRADRIAIVHSGIAVEETRRAGRFGVRGVLGLAPDALVAVNVGALVAHKDHATLLRTAARLDDRFPSLHWVIAGEGPERGALERLRDELRLNGRLHLLGEIAEPARVIADADLFVMSSREEGLGTSVLDAMALGIPVASTAAGGLPEMLEGGAGALAPPGDPVALARAVGRLLDDAALTQQTVARAGEVVERFTAARMAEAVRTVYRSCAPFP